MNFGLKRNFTKLNKNDEEEIKKKIKLDSVKYEEVKIIKTQNINNNPRINISHPLTNISNNSNLLNDTSAVVESEIKTLPAFSYLKVPVKDLMSGLNNIKLSNCHQKKKLEKENKDNKINNQIFALKRNFSYTDLKTELRSNFKNSFQDVIKNKNNQKCINSNQFNKSFSSFPSNFSNLRNDKDLTVTNATLSNSSNIKKISRNNTITKNIKEEEEPRYQTPKFNTIVENKNSFHLKSNNLSSISNLDNKKIILPLMKVNINKTSLKLNKI